MNEINLLFSWNGNEKKLKRLMEWKHITNNSKDKKYLVFMPVDGQRSSIV